MGHYCWMCNRSRSNESFSGGGHRDHVCRACARLPAAKKVEIMALRDIDGFLEQSNFSKGNLRKLRTLCESPNTEVQCLARLALDIALVAPRRRKRFGLLKRRQPELWARAVEAGLVHDYSDDNGPALDEFEQMHQ